LDKIRPNCYFDGMAEDRGNLDARLREVLRALLGAGAPVSGRRLAQTLGLSPTTVGNRLKALLERGYVNAQPSGAAVLWSANEANAEVRAARRELESVVPTESGQAKNSADISSWGRPVAADNPVVKVVVLTALQLEYSAVRYYLNDVERRRTRSGTIYEVGRIYGEHLTWDAHLAEIDMGNAGAAAEVAGAIDAFLPDLILFVGIAGGLKPADQNHGDIVVGSAVYNVHAGKIVPGPEGRSEFLSRPVPVRITHRLSQLVMSVRRMDWSTDVPTSVTNQGIGPGKPDVLIRPIVAGEVVLADANSELRRRIARQHNDAAAIDMESFGIYETAHRYDVPVLTVRGLSDLIGDKNPEADRELQPLAATNAAGFAIALLRHAEEDDISRGPSGGGPQDRPENPRGDQNRQGGVPSPRESLARLAPGVEPWWRRLRTRRGEVADVVVAELVQQSVAPAGWLGRLKYRPPVWLRQDDQGDAWALAAAFAESHGSPHAAWLYDEAARLAGATGQDIVAALNLFSAALATARRPYLSQSHRLEWAVESEEVNAARAEAAELLSKESLRPFGPITALLLYLVNNDDEAVLAILPGALQVLGLDSRLYRQEVEVHVTEEIQLATSLFSELNETDPDLVDSVRCDLLMRVGYVLLEQSNIETSLRFFGQAREIAPTIAGPLVGIALARLRRLDNVGKANRTPLEVSSELAEIRQLALLARDRRRAWNVDSADGVAVAVRAQIFSDAEGALRLALPSPRGVATDGEAADPRVREAGALAALFVGDHPLALELASGIADPVERDLTRAMAFSRSPGSGNEAEQALRRALIATPEGRPDQLVRALLGLARCGVSILPHEPGNVSSELARLRETDAEAADLVEASAALHGGEPLEALVITRQYPQSVAAVELAAEAATDAGDYKQAFIMLDRAGRTRGDEALRVQAMYLAVSSDLHDEARRVADQLALSVDAEMRRRGLEVRLMLAERAGQWEEVSDFGRRLVGDETFELTDLRWGQHVIQYRWAIAGAEFNLRRIQQARKAVDDPDELVPTSATEAQLLLAILAASAASSGQGVDQSVGDTTSRYRVIERALATASSFPDNEEVMASAIVVVLSSRDAEPLPEALLSRVWKLQEDFFTRFPDSGRFRRIAVGENLNGLIEFLRTNFASGAARLTDFTRQVWLGIYPQSALAEIGSRSYAELLIKRLAGCQVACSVDARLTTFEQGAANSAREEGTVVIDTSALVLIEKLDEHSRRLVAQFSKVLFPASMRDDILLTRNALDLRSTGTLGWNPRLQRPQLTETPIETVNEWAEIGSSLVKLLEFLEIVPSKQAWSWDDSLQLASREGVALWADDVALREAARSSGVAAFGTLDLVNILVQAGRLSAAVLDQVIDRFRDAYAVDLPLNDRFSEIAAADSWEAKGYASLLLARPSFWNPPVRGFAEFTRLVGSLVSAGKSSESIASWSASALTGLAWATPPASRPRALAGLVAWVTLSTDGASIFPMLLDVGQDVMEAAAPSGDLIGQTVFVLTETLSRIVPTEQIGAIFTRLLVNLDPERRAEAMRSFFSVPRL
jgi:nucleoside phosphorylase/DNA-binding transcriptional ArsR family regulator